MARQFSGFSKKMHSFFRGLERNNTREWFAPRKEFFESEIRQPMIGLVGLINEDLKRISVEHSSATPAKGIYRIYRDTRFSKDKTPYKTHIAASFHRRGLPKHAGAGFYFGVSHEHVEVAGGMYMPGPQELAAVRQAMLSDRGRFLKLFTAPRLVRKMGPLIGEKLKRPAKGYEDAPAELAEHLKFKQMYFYITLDAGLALTGKLRREIVSRFELMAEALEWMNAAMLAARAEEGEEEARPVRPAPMW